MTHPVPSPLITTPPQMRDCTREFRSSIQHLAAMRPDLPDSTLYTEAPEPISLQPLPFSLRPRPGLTFLFLLLAIVYWLLAIS